MFVVGGGNDEKKFNHVLHITATYEAASDVSVVPPGAFGKSLTALEYPGAGSSDKWWVQNEHLPCCICLVIGLVSFPPRAEGLVTVGGNTQHFGACLGPVQMVSIVDVNGDDVTHQVLKIPTR